MPPASSAVETLLSQTTLGNASTIASVVAAICLIWYLVVLLVCGIGYVQIRRHYSTPPAAPTTTELQEEDAPHVTIVRPIKGLEPCLFDCLASTFRQSYPQDKIHVRFCIANRTEPALPILERLLQEFPEHDALILVEDEDVALQEGDDTLGPNPKIRNMSRAYREAIGDIIWIMDCNIWVPRGVCDRMVSRLEGCGSQHKYKLVHQLPLVLDTLGTTMKEETQGLLSASTSSLQTSSTVDSDTTSQDRTARTIGGGRFEEVFMSSAHPKFYTAINTVAVAPCIVGKSTMFRRSHLNSLTSGQGIDYFSHNICEDHLIGDLLWKQQIPEEKLGENWGKHALCFGDLAIQPMANMGLHEYWSRRVRWLRVRKFTVTLATLVEPGTESFLCSLYGAFAFTTLPFFANTFNIPQTWLAFVCFWLLSITLWCLVDRSLFLCLHSGASIEYDDETPSFVRAPVRPFGEWVAAWIGRESLALPIWIWAFWGGTKVDWRGRKFWVGMDMKVHEIGRKNVAVTTTDGNELVELNGRPKRRKD
nr:ceramide glucosyltransferase [Quercus suber]